MALQPDSRWEHIVGGVSPSGVLLPVSIEVLQQRADQLANLVRGVDGGPSELLATARKLLVQSWFEYDLLVQGCLVSLQAVEAAVRRHYPDKDKVPFKKLVNRAEEDGLLTPQGAEVLREAGVRLRNDLSHPADQKRYTLGMVLPMLRTSHLLVSELDRSATATP